MIPSEWLKITLNQLGTIVTGKTPLTNNSANFGGQIPFITPRDFNDLKMIIKTERYLTEKGAVSVKNAIIPPKTVMVSCIGSDMGKVAIAGKQCVTNQQINSIIIDKQYDYNYVYYNLSIRKDEFRGCAGGSAQPILNKGHFSQLDILLPPLLKQRAIARILGSLDDKIELNQKTNQTLEEMAQAIFKEWFIDFRFPGHEKVKFIDGLPEGWHIGKVANCSTRIENGGTPKRNNEKYWTNGDILWLTSGEVNNSIVFTAGNKITEVGLNNSSAKIFERGTTVVAMYGATAGEVTYLAAPMATNQACCGLKAKSEYEYYLYQILRLNKENLKMQARGSAQQNLSQDIISRFEIVVPEKSVGMRFNDLMTPIYEKMIDNLKQNSNLSKIRDTLLPKFISGEIDVSNREVS